jgi:imidazole glycerol-phosphate synthase subunit HisH
MSQVVLIDYGSGNLRSAEKALQEAARRSGSAARIVTTDDPEVVAAADRLVLPGVGAFAACMRALAARPGLIEAMTQNARDKGRPFLGVCVGMQLLATRGLEFGETAGLDWIAGDVRRIEPADPRLKVPHMGWNVLTDTRPHPLLAGEAEQTHMYFTHSFAFDAASPADVVARFDHGGAHAAVIARGNIAGVQFHPEKSQAAGLQLLANFLEWRP